MVPLSHVITTKEYSLLQLQSDSTKENIESCIIFLFFNFLHEHILYNKSEAAMKQGIYSEFKSEQILLIKQI